MRSPRHVRLPRRSGVLATPDIKAVNNGASGCLRNSAKPRDRGVSLVASAQTTGQGLASRNALFLAVLILLNELNRHPYDDAVGAGSRADGAELSDRRDLVGHRRGTRRRVGVFVNQWFLRVDGVCGRRQSVRHGSGPSLVGRAMKSGRGSMAPASATALHKERDAETAAAGVRCVITFPMRRGRRCRRAGRLSGNAGSSPERPAQRGSSVLPADGDFRGPCPRCDCLERVRHGALGAGID